MINIFEHTNYREYLKAYFGERRKKDKKFSHRWLAQKLDLATSNFIMLKFEFIYIIVCTSLQVKGYYL